MYFYWIRKQRESARARERERAVDWYSCSAGNHCTGERSGGMAKAWKKRKCRVDPSAVEIEGARAQGLALAEAWTRMRVLVYLCQYRDLPDRGLTPHSTKFNE
eukprot:Tamp_36817.p1 GENE.Tamp_36817~~Tamp_36817.p1  ORF type:complete len:103 (+),score=3.00 Tamp_36817:211-519(+)